MKINKAFQFFKGQSKILKHLAISIKASEIKQECLNNIFLFGPSGCGKSTLAFLIAKATKQKIHFFYGYYFKSVSDLFTCFSKVKANEIVFIDEIHKLKNNLFEYFFEIIDFHTCSLLFGKNIGAKRVKIKLEPFCLIVATTNLAKIKEAFLNRFVIFYQFADYQNQDLYLILEQLARKKKLKINENALKELVLYAKKNPRIANNLFIQIYDYAIVKKIGIITKNKLQLILNKLLIYENGINNIDLKYLSILNNGPKSIATIKQITKFSNQMIVDKIEPFLIKEGLILKSTKGRGLTNKGQKMLAKILNNKN